MPRSLDGVGMMILVATNLPFRSPGCCNDRTMYPPDQKKDESYLHINYVVNGVLCVVHANLEFRMLQSIDSQVRTPCSL